MNQHRAQLGIEYQVNEKLRRQKTELEEFLSLREKAEDALQRRERLAALGKMAAGVVWQRVCICTLAAWHQACRPITKRGVDTEYVFPVPKNKRVLSP